MNAFIPTRWSLVLRARHDTAEGKAALSELCAAYYDPVLQFLRCEGRDQDAARELTQEFFARVLQRGQLGAAEPARGRFRTYLLGAVKHFLADRRDHERRLKRGAGQALESLEACGADPTLEMAEATVAAAERSFDRQWALTLMDRALRAVEAEFNQAGKEEQFRVLKAWLVGETTALNQAAAAKRLGLTEGAVKVAVHRLRRRFRECLRAEIAQTISEDDDVEAELRYLVEVLAQG